MVSLLLVGVASHSDQSDTTGWLKFSLCPIVHSRSIPFDVSIELMFINMYISGEYFNFASITYCLQNKLNCNFFTENFCILILKKSMNFTVGVFYNKSPLVQVLGLVVNWWWAMTWTNGRLVH